MMHFDKLFIDGSWIEPFSGEVIEVENPANRSVVGSVPRGGEVDVNLAVEAASRAFPKWAATPVQERVRLMQSVLEYLEANREQLIDIEVKELGAPRDWAERAHVKMPIGRLKNYIKLMETFEFEVQLEHSVVLKEPIGVVGCITPWNYPLGQVMQKIVPAILCGNTVVLKPSQMTPLSAMILAKGIEAAGMPKGVFNLVTGKAGEVGNALAKHPKVDMISFTGSTSAGKEVGKLALDRVKKVALELGGKSANVILEGADYEAAVRSGLSSCYDNTGQTCAAWTRMIVPQNRKKEIEDLIIAVTKEYVVGDPTNPQTNIGPLASRKQYDKVRKYVELGISEGATVLLGEVPAVEPGEGYYVKPFVFTDVDNKMTIAQEEIFGPVICVIPYDTVEEAIEIANDSIYGLAGAVFGPEEEAKRVARSMRTGTVYINNGRRDVNAPFGGYKQSGIGREGGPFGVEEFLELKATF